MTSTQCPLVTNTYIVIQTWKRLLECFWKMTFVYHAQCSSKEVSSRQPAMKWYTIFDWALCITLHYITLHYITLHYRYFIRHLHLKWPVVLQQSYVRQLVYASVNRWVFSCPSIESCNWIDFIYNTTETVAEHSARLQLSATWMNYYYYYYYYTVGFTCNVSAKNNKLLS